jgi:hypothetical protein
MNSSDLDLELHETFDRRWRVAELIIITILGVVCCAALTGALGSGPLSHAQARFDSPNPSTLEYERIVRSHGSSWIRIALAQGASGPFSVHLDRNLLQYTSIDTTTPLPVTTQASGDGITYTFDTRQLHGASIDFKMSPYHFGVVHTTVSAGDAQVLITQVILP